MPVGVGIAVAPGEMELRRDREAAGRVRDLHGGRDRVGLLHGDPVLLGRAVRDQGLLGRVHTGGRLGAVVAGEYGGQVLPGLALGGFSRQGEGQRIGTQLAELRRAAALDVGQHQREALLGCILVGDQLDGYGDLVNGACKGQRAVLGRVVHAGLRGPVHGLVIDRHVVAGPAGPADCRLRHAGLPVHGDGGDGEAQLRGLARVVVRHHQRQRVAKLAELAALAADDGEQAQLRQLGKLVVQRRDADIFDRFAVGKAQVKGVHIVIIFKFNGGIARLLQDLNFSRYGACLRPGGELLPMEGKRAEQSVLHRQNAAEVQILPACDAEDAVILPAQLQRGLVGAFHVLPEAAGRSILPAPAACLLRVDQTEYQTVLPVCDRLQADRRSGLHLSFRFGQADLLIGSQRIRIFGLDQQIALAGGRIVVDVFLPALVGGDGGGIGDSHGDPPGGATDAVNGQQRRLWDLRTLGRQRAGLRHVRLIGAKGKGTVGIGFVPILVRRDLALRRDKACRLLSLLDGLRVRRPTLHRQDRAEHTNAEQGCNKTLARSLHGCFPPFFSFWECVDSSVFPPFIFFRMQSSVMSTPSRNASTTAAKIPPVLGSSRKEPIAAVSAPSRSATGVDETVSVRTSRIAHRLRLKQARRLCSRFLRRRSLRFRTCSSAFKEL